MERYLLQPYTYTALAPQFMLKIVENPLHPDSAFSRALTAVHNDQPLTPQRDPAAEARREMGKQEACEVVIAALGECKKGSRLWKRLDRAYRSMVVAGDRNRFGTAVWDRFAALGALRLDAQKNLARVPGNPTLLHCIQSLKDTIISVAKKGGDCSSSRGYGLAGINDRSAEGYAMVQVLKRADQAIAVAQRITSGPALFRLENGLPLTLVPTVVLRTQAP